MEEKRIVWSYENFFRVPTFTARCIVFSINQVCAFLNKDGTRPHANRFVLRIYVIAEPHLNNLILSYEADSFEEAESKANEIARKMELI